MTLQEAFDKAYHSLNAGGVPVVLSRYRNGVRVLEVRLRWTGSPDPYSSMRSPMIVEVRKRTEHDGWTNWAADETPFAPDDLHFASWEVRYPDHLGCGTPCKRCEEAELRTDAAMIAFYGPFKHEHSCALRLFPEED